MAVIAFDSTFDPNNAFLGIPTEIDPVVSASSTRFEVGDLRFTLLRFEGTGFAYSSSGTPTSGTITGFVLLQSGKPAVTVSGLSPLSTLQQAESLRLTGSPGALLKYLLSGDDVAIAGAGDQVIISEAGNDTLDGGTGADYIVAGDGNDVVISSLGQGPGGGSIERLFGGAGVDKLLIDRSDQALSFVFDIKVDGISALLDGTELSGFEQMEFHSGSGNDDLAAGDLADWITAGSGSDRISGRGGDDTLSGGDGADNISGGAGNDLITGDEGLDALDGGAGDDTIDGGAQADHLFGAEGNDVLSGGLEADNIDGASGSDILYGGSGADNLNGGSEDDLLVGDGGIDVLDGGTGNDTIDGGTQSDNLFGGEGDDLLIGGPGTDYLEGGSGNDVYIVDSANDVLFDAYGEGYDVVITTGSFALTGAAAVEVLRTAEPKSKRPLSLKGNEYNNLIEGNAGPDTINGSGGSDTLKGGRGRDTFVLDSRIDKHNIDKILDFRVKDDSFRLSRSIFRELTGHKILAEEAFCIGPKAADETDRIVYDPHTGRLYYDEDGIGAIKSVLIARLSKGLALTESDFLI